MMEFTISRVAAIVCGVILLAAVMVPFTNVMDENEEEHYQKQCDNISEMLNAFSESRTEEMMISMNTILPSEDSYLELDGHIVKLTVGVKEYQSVTRDEIESVNPFDCNDVVKLVKEGDVIMASCESD